MSNKRKLPRLVGVPWVRWECGCRAKDGPAGVIVLFACSDDCPSYARLRAACDAEGQVVDRVFE